MSADTYLFQNVGSSGPADESEPRRHLYGEALADQSGIRVRLALSRVGDDWQVESATITRSHDSPDLADVKINLGELRDMVVRLYRRSREPHSELLPATLAKVERGKRWTPDQMRELAEVVHKADADGLSRVAAVKSEFGCSDRTAYRRIAKAIEDGLIGEQP